MSAEQVPERTGGRRYRQLARAARGPVVELARTPHRYRITFVFADERLTPRRVLLICPALPEGIADMHDAGDGTFVLPVELPAGTRVGYWYSIDPDSGRSAGQGIAHLLRDLRHRRVDPFNPRLQRSPVAKTFFLTSVLELPGAVALMGRRRYGALRHGVASTELAAPGILSHEVAVTTYLPTQSPQAVVVLVESSGEWGDPSVLFDDVHAQSDAVPFLGLHVAARSVARRLHDLADADGRFTRFLEEIVGSAAPDDRVPVVLAGFSAGAKAALATSVRLPELFARVVLLSGAFHLDQTMNFTVAPGEPVPLAWLQDAPALPHRAYLAAGLFEGDGQFGTLSQTLALSAELARRGVDVRTDLGPTGHEFETAAARMAEGLRWLLDPPRD
ncbi:hypothetical protein AB0H36_33965 [Kribbella sp. NPDC050820]|uniref:hypothetical protein n=1 Tax=Kribbella sp. NPDC050820 TaxID=3155408 RepID=UPI0033F5E8F7